MIGGLGAPVVAQDEAAAGNFTPVTGQRLTESVDDSGSYPWHDIDNWYLSGVVNRGTYAWSDPRLPTDGIGLLSVGGFGGEDGVPGQFLLGQMLFEGPDGYWTGPMHAYFDGDAVGHSTWLLTGHDAYEGLTALLMGTIDDPECIECLTFTGAIFEGAMPTWPEPLEPSAD